MVNNLFCIGIKMSDSFCVKYRRARAILYLIFKSLQLAQRLLSVLMKAEISYAWLLNEAGKPFMHLANLLLRIRHYVTFPVYYYVLDIISVSIFVCYSFRLVLPSRARPIYKYHSLTHNITLSTKPPLQDKTN